MMNEYLLARELGNPLGDGLQLRKTQRLWRTLKVVDEELFTAFHQPAGVSVLDAERKGGRLMLSGGASGAVALWDLWKPTPREPIAKSPRKGGHKFAVSAVSFYPVDPGMFVTGSFDTTVKVWDSEEMEVAHTFSLEESVFDIAMDPKGRHTLVAASAGHNVRLLDLASGSPMVGLMGLPKGANATAVAWSPKDEHSCAAGSDDGRVAVWDKRVPTKPLMWVSAKNERVDKTDKRNRGHIGAVHGLTWSEDGLNFYTTGNDKQLRAWKVSTGQDWMKKYPVKARGTGQQVINPVLVPATQADPQLIFVTSGTDIHGIRVDSGLVEQKIQSPADDVIAAMIARTDEPGLLCGTLGGHIRALDGSNFTPQADAEEAKRRRLNQIYQSFLQNPITLP